MNPKILIIAGPTASGKTNLAFEIAQKYPCTIINADSMQIYDSLETLTNSPNKTKLKKFSCKLFGTLNINQTASLGWWLNNAVIEIKQALAMKRIPIVVGGTGMYLDGLQNKISNIPSVPKRIRDKILEIHAKKGNKFFHEKLKKIDPVISKKINKNDTQRLIRAIEVKVFSGKNLSEWQKSKILRLDNHYKKIFVVLTVERNKLYETINKRFLKMMKNDVLDEIKHFLKKKIDFQHPLNKCIGLKHFKSYINGEISYEHAVYLGQRDTKNYAKRQITWFKNQPRNAYYLKYNKAKDFIFETLKY